MFCKKCGTQLSGDSKFCVACGTKVEAVQPVTPGTPTVPVVEQSVVPVPAPAEPAKKKIKPLAIILPIIAVILVVAIVLGVVFFDGENSSDDKETDRENISSTAIADGTENTNTDASQKPTDENYYLDKEIVYEYDENGEVYETRTIVYYGKYRFPLEETTERNDYLSSGKFELDDDNKIIGYSYVYESEDENENWKIDIEYEEKDGKQVGVGSLSVDGHKAEFEIIYESDDEFTVAMKADGELFEKWTCYINDDGYSVTECEKYYSSLTGDSDFKCISIYDGIKLIEESSYIKEGDSFELISSEKNEYNNDGFLVETFYPIGNGKIIYERNENNVPISITSYHNGEKKDYSKIDKEYDDKIILGNYTEDDFFTGSHEYGFDEEKLLYEKVYDECSYLKSETTYNENGLPEETITYLFDGYKQSKTVYNEYGLPEEIISYSDGEISSKTVYEYEKR